MERIKVESSNVCSIGYDPENGILEVQFWRTRPGRFDDGKEPGPIYRYASVSAAEYESLRTAESVGKALQYIKRRAQEHPDMYACTKMPEEEAPDPDAGAARARATAEAAAEVRRCIDALAGPKPKGRRRDGHEAGQTRQSG